MDGLESSDCGFNQLPIRPTDCAIHLKWPHHYQYLLEYYHGNFLSSLIKHKKTLCLFSIIEVILVVNLNSLLVYICPLATMTVKNTTNGNGNVNGNIRAAIIGGGPGGLGAAIALAKLSFVDWTLYEKKHEISETGGGISLQPHTWKMLEWNGSSKNIKPSDLFRSPDGISGQQR